MIVLTQHEILEELKKFGIHSPSELNEYSREYLMYFTVQYVSENN